MNRNLVWVISLVLVIQIASFSFEETPTIVEFNEPSFEDTSPAYGRNNSSGGNNSGGNNSTGDAHCLILNNATMNQTNYVSVDLINTCSAAIMYPGINASSDNSGVGGLYDIWWYVVGGNNTTIHMGWQLSINQSVQNGTGVTLYFEATVLNCGPNNSWANDCPTSTLSYQFTVLNNNTGGNNTGGNNTGGNNTGGNNTGGNNTGGNNTGGNNTGGNNTVNQEWIEFGFSNNHSNYVGVGESLEGEYSVGLMNPGVNYNVNLTVWRDNGTLFQTHSYVESTTFTSNDENAYGIYNNAEHSDWIPLAAGAPGQYNMDGDCFYALAALYGNGTYITETIYEFSVTTVDCDYHYNNNSGNNTGGNNTGGNNTGGNNTGNNTGGNNTGGNNTGNNTGGNNSTANTAPQISSVLISPSSALETDVLTCSYIYYDAELDPDASIFVWTINGATVTSVSSVLASGYVAGDFVTCAVLAYDGMDYGNMGTSTVLIMANSTGGSGNTSGGILPSIGVAGTLATIGLSFIAVTRRGRED